MKSPGIDLDQFVELVVEPALHLIELHSRSAVELLLGTALQESRLRYLKQIQGPALGVFQMEPDTHDDIWLNYLSYRPLLSDKLKAYGSAGEARALAWNLQYAAAMCRVHYLRVPKPLPAEGDIQAQAEYWKRYYNTSQGAGTVTEYLETWRLYTTPRSFQ